MRRYWLSRSWTTCLTCQLKSHIRDSSLYDNIFFQTNHVIEYTSENGIERFDETDFWERRCGGELGSKRSSSRMGNVLH